MIVVLDTETNGLPHEERASVIEVGAVCVDFDGAEVSVFSSLVKPLHPLGSWSDKAMSINEIPAAWLEKAPEPERVWDLLLGWMQMHKPVTQVLAYNRPFDEEMMKRTFPVSEHLPWGPCLMLAAAQHIHGPKRKRLGLKKAAVHFKIPYEHAHRAIDDARVAAAVGAKIMAERNAS